MRARGAAHTNGTATNATATPAPAMPAHLAAMTTSDEVESHIAQLSRRIAALPPNSHTPSSTPPAATASDRPTLSAELALARLRLSAIRANGRYLALLACGALFVVFVVCLLCGWQSPIVQLHRLVNAANQDRMARLGLSEQQLGASRDDQAFVAAFDWWSWLLPQDSGNKQQPM